MLLVFLAGQLLLVTHSVFSYPSANCPAPIFITESLLDPWVGVSVDIEQTQITVQNGLNFLTCEGDSLFAAISLKGVLTRTNWWLTCDDKAKNGWRVKDAAKKNANYGRIPVGCVKPTCGDLQVFDGNEYVLGNYPNLQIVPAKPSLPTNGKFQFVCPRGSTLGFATSATNITLNGKAKITCENDGWSMKTPTDSTGHSISDVKVGCFQKITPPALPSQCQTGINYFTGEEQILKDVAGYTWNEGKTAVVNGEWKFVCPAGASIGREVTATTFMVAKGASIICAATGWSLITPENSAGAGLTGKVGCFTKKAFSPSANCPDLSFLTQSLVAPWAAVTVDETAITIADSGTNKFECKPDARFTYLDLMNQTNLWSTDLSMECSNEGSDGWKTVHAADGEQGPKLEAVVVGCIKPSCPELLLFDGTETVVLANPGYELVPTTPSLPGGRFELACPPDCGIGYSQAEANFIFDKTMRIGCQNLGWWVSSPTKQGRLSPTTRVGCFRKTVA